MFKALDKLALWVERHSPLIFIVFLVYLAIMAANRPYDPTDDAENETRSGLYHYVDHGTGCEYIKASWFAELTPRLDSSGRQVCDG